MLQYSLQWYKTEIQAACMFISFVIMYDLIHPLYSFFVVHYFVVHCGIVLFGKGCQIMCLRRQYILILYLLHWKQIPSNAYMCARF